MGSSNKFSFHIISPSLIQPRNLHQHLAVLVFLLLVPPSSHLSVTTESVKNWALRFGKDIYEGSAEATCLRKIEENYHNMKAVADYVSCNDMLTPMHEMLTNMFNWKKDALKKIGEEAEKRAKNAPQDVTDRVYVNSKRLHDVNEADYEGLSPNQKDWAYPLTPHAIFRNVPVNDNVSAVHIPVNVYEDTPNLKDAIRWSEGLKDTFTNNRKNDTELNWQFFCSAKGFFRFFPASKWRTPQFLTEARSDDPPLDLYDCRLREWYVKAAASPKDIVILLDGSGSMSGQRKEIARNLLESILDTLTDDDFVTVVRFSDEIQPVVNCFGYKLVEANKQNARLFKESVSDLNTTDIADFRKALMKAFEILQAANRSGEASQCNQAIMLITDGAPDTYREIFERYNYPRISIRVFTYLVGKEVTETKEVNLMACENRGYYTQVTSLSEIRELVQLYLPVMSRPLVLSNHRVFRFTGVYADITDVPLTPWVWDGREREKIRKMLAVRRVRELPTNENSENLQPLMTDLTATDQEDNDSEKDEDYHEKPAFPNESANSLLTSSRLSHESSSKIHFQKTRKTRDVESELPTPNAVSMRSIKKSVHELMTTISLPVFDTENTTIITERYLMKNVWRERKIKVRSANLLGVAGIDVPIREIVRRTPAYKLGVNGYSFAINNNGHILFHPDLRPLFQDLLKPFYSSVDLLEVEMPNTSHKPREYNSTLMEMRNLMINGAGGWKTMDIKMHIDSMKRAVTRQHVYCYYPISGTPFSLAISLPKPYGEARVIGEIEIKRRDENYTHYFRGDNWRVHPDWVYCDTEDLKEIRINSPQEGIRHFLKKAAENEANIWYLEPSRIPPGRMSRLTCEKELVRSLVFDAKATDIDAKGCGTSVTSNLEKEVTNMYGVTLTFVSTRSGLTRFEDHRSPEEKSNGTDDPEKQFIETHTRAIDELFYQRAVDYHRYNSSAFLFSVPFNAGDSTKPIYVTGSQAIFVGQGKTQAPVAVVGLLIKHRFFAERFFNFSTKCVDEGCKVDCSTQEFDCYLIDNNGFIIASSEIYRDHVKSVGKFFGEIDNAMFRVLVEKRIYQEVRMYDYQAICIEKIEQSGPGFRLESPLDLLKRAILSFWSKLSVVVFEFYFGYFNAFVKGEKYYTSDSSDSQEGSDFMSYVENTQGRRKPPNKSRPFPCDKEFNIYEAFKLESQEPIADRYTKCDECEEDFIVKPVPYTNLFILIVSASCSCEPPKSRINPTQINYLDDCTYETRRYNLPRKRLDPSFCKNSHPEEREIKQCGLGMKLTPTSEPMIAIIVVTIFHLICIRHLLDIDVNKLMDN